MDPFRPDPPPPPRRKKKKLRPADDPKNWDKPPLAELDSDTQLNDPVPDMPEEYLFEDDPVEIVQINPDGLGLTILEQEELREIVAEKARREGEALQLYEPMPEQERFHACHAGERIIRGGNRGGKTLAACVELARAVTGQDPYHKYTERDGRAIVVGLNLNHCSKVVYRKLFVPGAFQIIRDPDTGKMRAFRPGTEWDDAHAHLSKPAPPLIPRRFYGKGVSWKNKREDIPNSVKFTTGWELSFFSSIAPPPQGWDADVGYFDEEISHPKWYVEVSARLLDRRKFNPLLGVTQNGKFWWSATPQAGTQRLYDLSAKAEECRDDPSPHVVEFFVNLLTNIHITQASKDDFIKKLEGSEEDFRIRVLGEFAIVGQRVYPSFAPRGVHGCKAFEIPREWTRYAYVDPGHQVCAVLFVAIAPPNTEYANRKIIYDELYIKRCNAKIFAERMKLKVGDTSIYDWTIDHHAGRITEIGSGKTHEEQYSGELKIVGLRCERRGFSFAWSSDDVLGGLEAVRNGLHIRDGISEWLVFNDVCMNFIWEAERYSNRKDAKTGVPLDDPIQKDNHLMDCWRYAAMTPMRYVKPRVKKRDPGYTNIALKKKRERAKKESGWNGSIKLG